jgi:hypothetical protein
MKADRQRTMPERAHSGERDAPAKKPAVLEHPMLEARGLSFDRMGNRALLSLLRSGRLQRKARISQPGDDSEREADRAANQVVSGEGGVRLTHAASSQLQCMLTDDEQLAKALGLTLSTGQAEATVPESAEAAVADARESERGAEIIGQLYGGRSLDESTRGLMESRFGENFSDVRIHTGDRAAEAAAMLHARAFTVRQDIVFGEEQFAPETTQGQRLLAHELAHVVQQRQPTGPNVGEREAEREARDAARELETGGTPTVRERVAPGAVQKYDAPPWMNSVYNKSLKTARKFGLPGVADGLEMLNEVAGKVIENSHLSNAQVNAVVERAKPILQSVERALDAVDATVPADEVKKLTAHPPSPLPPVKRSTTPETSINLDLPPALRPTTPVTVSSEPIWLGNPALRPSWARNLRIWKDAQGTTNIWSPELGLTYWDIYGRRHGPLPNADADKIARWWNETQYLQSTGGRRFVEGQWLDEQQWTAYLDRQAKTYGDEANRNLDRLEGAIREWEKMKDKSRSEMFPRLIGGPLFDAPFLSELFGGRLFDDPWKYLGDARRDLAIALHGMGQVKTPDELPEAIGHVRFATSYGERQFSSYQEDIYGGGATAIKTIEVGAVVTTAVVAAPVIFTALGGATVTTLGGQALVLGGTGVGTGLLTGTVGGAVESAERGLSWENYGQGVVDYFPLGFSYGTGFVLGRFVGPGLLRGVIVDASVSGTSSAIDQALHGGSFEESLQAGGEGFLTGGGLGLVGRGFGFKSLPSRVSLDVGTSVVLSYLSGADQNEMYRQGLIAFGLGLGGALGERAFGAAPGPREPAPAWERWMQSRIRGLSEGMRSVRIVPMLTVGGVPGLGIMRRAPQAQGLEAARQAGIPKLIYGDAYIRTRANFPDIVPDAPTAIGRAAPPRRPYAGREVSASDMQNRELAADIMLARRAGARNIRVNQWQVIENLLGGINRPDLYFELNGKRVHIEYDRFPMTRAEDHARRILSNDPEAVVILKGSDYEPPSR